MILARSILYFLLMSLSVLVYGLPIALGSRLRLLSYERLCEMANAWGRSNLYLLRQVCHLDYHISGLDNVPERGCIVMSKHQSAWETLALRALLPPHQTWVLKRELMRIPVFGWALAAAEPIAIDRGAGRKAVRQVIEQGKAALDKGRIVVIFPEGTRVAPGQHKKYGLGGALLAEHSGGYPIVPIAHNAGVFWARRGIIKYPGTIQVVVGSPIETRGKNAKQIIAEVEEWIESRMRELPQTREPVTPTHND